MNQQIETWERNGILYMKIGDATYTLTPDGNDVLIRMESLEMGWTELNIRPRAGNSILVGPVERL